MSSPPDYYRVLNLQAKRSRELAQSEVRQAYKQALLHYHPDKKTISSRANQESPGPVPSVDQISEAYRTLADPKLRTEYDRQKSHDDESSQQVNTRHTGMETADLEDLEYHEETGVWTRPCRCGSQPAFVITEPELEKHVEFGELITGCKGCSLWLRVLFSAAE